MFQEAFKKWVRETSSSEVPFVMFPGVMIKIQCFTGLKLMLIYFFLYFMGKLLIIPCVEAWQYLIIVAPPTSSISFSLISIFCTLYLSCGAVSIKLVGGRIEIFGIKSWGYGFMVFNATFNNFGSQFYWWWKPGYPEKTTDLLQVTDKLTLSHNVVSSTPRHEQGLNSQF